MFPEMRKEAMLFLPLLLIVALGCASTPVSRVDVSGQVVLDCETRRSYLRVTFCNEMRRATSLEARCVGDRFMDLVSKTVLKRRECHSV